jgi:uncharacterized protein
MGRKYRIISGDGHIETPPEPWVARVDERHRNRAPRLVRLPDGQGDAWIVEGQGILHTGQNITGRGPVKFAHATYFDADGNPAEGTGDAVSRLREQDLDGIDAELMYPPVFATRFINGIADRDAYLAMVRGYNTWLIEDYCSVAPDRLIGVAFMPVSGIDDAIAELEWAHAQGYKAICMQQFPNGSGASKIDVDSRFWARTLELGMPLAPHITFGDNQGPPPKGPAPSDAKMASGMTQHVGGVAPGYTMAQMIVDGVFERFPELRFYFAEVNCATLPSMMFYMDRDYEGYNDWFQGSLPKPPSQYFRDHCLFGMIREPLALQMGDFMPLDWFVWASDFPHSVGTYPESPKYIEEAFAHLDPQLTQLIVRDNIANLLGLDLDADITETPVG